MSKRRVIQEEQKAQMNTIKCVVTFRSLFPSVIITVVLFLLFCDVTHAFPFQPPLQNVSSGVERDENSVEVWYTVYVPTTDSWERDSTIYRSDPGELWLMRKLLNQDGVVVWNIDHYDGSDRYLEKRVEYAVYDSAKGSWQKGSNSYRPDPGEQWLMRKFFNQEGIVAWYIDRFNDFSNVYLEKRIEYAVYYDSEGWQSRFNSYPGDATISDFLIQGSIIHYNADGISHKIGVFPIEIPDPKLRAAIRQIVGKYHVTFADLNNISSNQITDISSLAGLNKLEYLSLIDNQISDINPLSNLTNLSVLYLEANRITDISALGELTKIGPHDRCRGWTVGRNGISEIHLMLNYNQISDISPLVSNAGLDKGDAINLKHNPLNVEAYASHIPALQERGVKLLYDQPSGPYNPPSDSIDVNNDGTIDHSDLLLLGNHFGEKGSVVIGDINDDGIVDISDLVLIGRHFGE